MTDYKKEQLALLLSDSDSVQTLWVHHSFSSIGSYVSQVLWSTSVYVSACRFVR